MTEALTVDVVDSAGKKTGSVELPAEVFDAPLNLSLIHISEPTRRLRGSRMPSSA